MIEVADHPARFSDDILPVIERYLEPGSLVLDPFAGVGRIHELTTVFTIGVEIEPEWATAHPRTIVGDATFLPSWWTGMFDAVATSPGYANRMSDSHNAQERCRACQATGKHPDSWEWATPVDCAKCNGLGRRKYRRITYTHYIGRKLHPNNSGQMQWGQRYRSLHERSWAEVRRVLRDPRPGEPPARFVLNISDHVRKGEVVEVVDWHLRCCEKLGFVLVDQQEVKTPRMLFGENREKRVEYEVVALFEKRAA